MKLKLDKKFEPAEIDEGDELFPNGLFEFNITKLLAFIQVNQDDFPIELISLDTLWEPSRELSTDPVRPVNLQVPIISAEISPGKFNVIDGNHRVEKARPDGLKTLPARKVRPDQHRRFLTSVNAYKRYTDYWNEKVVTLTLKT